jgi:hypothetical protein
MQECVALVWTGTSKPTQHAQTKSGAAPVPFILSLNNEAMSINNKVVPIKDSNILASRHYPDIAGGGFRLPVDSVVLPPSALLHTVASPFLF